MGHVGCPQDQEGLEIMSDEGVQTATIPSGLVHFCSHSFAMLPDVRIAELPKDFSYHSVIVHWERPVAHFPQRGVPALGDYCSAC